MLHRVVLILSALFFITSFSAHSALALTVQVMPNQNIIAQDKELGVDFTVRTITYSHSFFELNWLDGNNQNSFKIVFTSNTLKNIPLESSSFLVKSSSLGFISPTTQDRFLLLTLATKISGIQKFPQQKELIYILNQLGALPNGSYLYNNELCENKGQWIYGSYNVSGTTKIVLTPIGDQDSQCYGNCGSKCSTWLGGAYHDACLSHDLCHRIEGTQLGSCKDEFGYATAATTASAGKSCPINSPEI